MSIDQRVRSGLSAELAGIRPDVASMLMEVESDARRQRTRHNRVLAAAAAVAALAGVVWVGGSLGWVTGQEDVRPAEQPVEWRVDPDGDWVRVEDPDFQEVNSLSAVIDLGGRLVAVGHGQTPIVTSTDGVDWAAADVPAASLQYLISGGPGAIASGSTMDGNPALWTSPDGLAWSQVDDPADLTSAADSGLRVVTVGGPAFEAVDGRQPTTWISNDGLTWMPIDATEDSVAIADLTMGGPGFVAVGLADLDGEAWGSPPQAADEEMHTGAVWTSVDGRTWSRVPHDPQVFSPDPWVEMTTVTAGDAGLVAVGYADSGAGNGRTLVWASEDGLAWTRVLDELDVVRNIDGYVAEVIDTGREFLAMGQRCCQEQEVPTLPVYPNAEMWTSVDGRTWDRIEDDSFGAPADHAAVIHDVIETPSGLVAVGAIQTTQDDIDTETAAVWLLEQP